MNHADSVKAAAAATEAYMITVGVCEVVDGPWRRGLLMSKNPDAFDDLKPNRGNDDKPLRALGINHGEMVYLKYSVEREPTPTMQAQHRSELRGGKMTVESMIAQQTRIERQVRGARLRPAV